MLVVVLATNGWRTRVCGMAAFGQCSLGSAIKNSRQERYLQWCQPAGTFGHSASLGMLWEP